MEEKTERMKLEVSAMSLLESVRAGAFWLIDFINQSSIAKTVNMIRSHQNTSFDDPSLIQHKDSALSGLLVHATNHCPFYSKYKDLPLTDFPVIDKHVINSNYESFLADNFNKLDLVTMRTSGSTGTPFVVYQNKNKKKRVHGEIIHYSGLAGYKVGSKLIYLRSFSTDVNKPAWKQWIQNEVLINVNNLSDLRIEQIIGEIEAQSKNGAVLMSYASTYDAIAEWIRRNPDRVFQGKVHGMISGAEMLYDDTRNIIERFFKCPCFSRYSNQENGVLGQDSKENNVFLLNDSNYLIEVLKFDSNEPVENGEVGRIVVTDYYNYAMPMIRYDTGDVGAIIQIKTPTCKKNAINQFGGRRVDAIFNTSNDRISPHAITNAMRNIQGIKQYQFHQVTNNDYLVHLNVDSDFNQEQTVKDMLMPLLGQDASIQFEYVSEIPVLSSGKRSYIVGKDRQKRKGQ